MKNLSLFGLAFLASQSAASESQSPLAPTIKPLSIPLLGFGTWNLKEDGHNASKAVETAIKVGYRHIDCAKAYSNEKDVGRGIADGLKAVGLKREDIHVTSKLWNSDHHVLDVEPALDKTLHDLGLEYLDLYLMHWPVASRDGKNEIDFVPSWNRMVKLLDTGKVRNVGVSNFSPDQLSKLIREAKGGVKPAVHQMELHPYLPQADWVLWHQVHGIHVTAYSPLGNMNPTYDGKATLPSHLLKNEKVLEVAKRAGCPPSNVVLAWGMYRGTSVIPKSQHPDHIEDNFKATDCDLSYEDLKELSTLSINPFRFNNPSKSWDVPLYTGLDGV